MSRQANERRKLDGQDRKPKPHEVGLQVPRSIHTEESKKGAVRSTADTSRGGVSRVGSAQREPDRRGPFDGRPRSHDDINTAEIRGVKRGGLLTKSVSQARTNNYFRKVKGSVLFKGLAVACSLLSIPLMIYVLGHMLNDVSKGAVSA